MSASQIDVVCRKVSSSDVAAMAESRSADSAAGPADERMAAYFAGQHHPQRALAPRTGFVAVVEGAVVGYVAGHLTERFGCQGELQYLYVSPRYRRSGVARDLVRHLAAWFLEQKAHRVCVNVDDASPGARAFYVSIGASDLQPHWMHWPDVVAVFPPAAKRRVDQEL